MRIERDLSRLGEPFDVAVIGGGITGVHVAREAAGRGLHVVMIDKGDFGGGTSSATSKLIHGGIRYLETYEFGVVRESLRERRILALGAPHLVEPRRFIMPGWSWSKPPTALIGAGVGLYTAFGYDRNRKVPPSLRMPMPRWLSKADTLRAVPWLDDEELQGAFAYHDIMNVHPERLLLGYVKSAAGAGAVMINHVEAVGFVTEPRTDDGVDVAGVEVRDRLTGTAYTIRARAIVNAAGPWLDEVLARTGHRSGVQVSRSKGVHILTSPVGGAGRVSDTVFARAKSGQHVIVSPWQGKSFIGPTDTPIDHLPDDVRATRDDVDLLLDTLNATFNPRVEPVTVDDVEAATVGTRPLLASGSDSSYRASRRHEIFNHRRAGLHHLWSIGGGKWTTGRAMGVAMVEELLGSSALFGVRAGQFDSTHAVASGAFAWAEDAAPYLDAAVSARASVEVPTDVRVHVARLYGTDFERILDLVEQDRRLGERVSDRPGCLDIAAQAVFAVTDEGARTLSDIVDRRLVLGTLGRVTRDELQRVGAAVAQLFGFDDADLDGAVEAEYGRREARRSHWQLHRSPVG